MKKTLIVVAHPNPKSFNKSGILQTAKDTLEQNGHQVEVRDLYELNFNPVLSGADFELFHKGEMPADIKKEQEFISWADNIIIINPIWWIGRPAILQGYFDRVFAYGFAFSVTPQGPVGLLKNEKALVINTAGSPEFLYDSWENSKQLLGRPTTEGALNYSGIKNVNHVQFYGIATSTDEQRQEMLERIKTLLKDF
jgi:NAD(P)H dehydrogenase (quinone)